MAHDPQSEKQDLMCSNIYEYVTHFEACGFTKNTKPKYGENETWTKKIIHYTFKIIIHVTFKQLNMTSSNC